MASWQTKLKEWAGRAYTVFEDLEPIAEELQSYFTNRLVFDQNRQLILEIIVSGLPNEIQSIYQDVKDKKDARRVSQDVKDKRILWNTKIRPRIFRMIDTLGDLMYGRLVRSREEMEAELEAERKKQRTEETPSVIASAIDKMAIDDNSKPSGEEVMEVSEDKQPVAKGAVPPPNSNTYDLSLLAERDRYRRDVDAYIRANPYVPPPHPIPDVLMPKIDAIDTTDEEKTEEFKKQVFSWNQEAMEINGAFGAQLPVFSDDGIPSNENSTQASSRRDDGVSSITHYSEHDDEGTIEELITDDEDENQVVLVKTRTETTKFKKGDIRIPKRFLKGETVVTFNGMRSNSSIVIAEQEDYYCTPEGVTALILKYLEKYHSRDVIWDCCDGNGEMSNVLKESGFTVVCTDLYTKKDSNERLDYLSDTPPFHYDIMVCNPPFSKKHDFLDRAIRLKKPFIMLFPTNILSRRRTVTAFKKGFFKAGLVVPAPKFVPKEFDGTPKDFVMKKGEKVPYAKAVGDCLWLFGFAAAGDGDDATQTTLSVKDDFTLTKGVVGLSLLTDVRSIIEYCI